LNATKKRLDDPNKHKGTWTDVTLEEMKAYYGLLILMGIMRYDRDEMYWTNNADIWLVGSRFGEVMSRNRFFQIRRYLHFSDESQAAPHDKLHKIDFILKSLRESFRSEYLPHREISVDEAMVPFKGRLGIKQYMKDKPVKWGVKLWVAADAVSAYCLNFEVYVGKQETVRQTLGMSSRVVVEMVKHLEMKGHVIYTDNYYTSCPLADYLYSRDTYLCGTIRTNRKGYPKALVKPAKEVKKIERGHSDWLMCDHLLASYWKDNRIVYYLSTFHRPEDLTLVTTRTRKDGTPMELKATPTQKGYAEFMGGVDRMDQMTRMNKEKKSNALDILRAS